MDFIPVRRNSWNSLIQIIPNMDWGQYMTKHHQYRSISQKIIRKHNEFSLNLYKSILFKKKKHRDVNIEIFFSLVWQNTKLIRNLFQESGIIGWWNPSLWTHSSDRRRRCYQKWKVLAQVEVYSRLIQNPSLGLFFPSINLPSPLPYPCHYLGCTEIFVPPLKLFSHISPIF